MKIAHVIAAALLLASPTAVAAVKCEASNMDGTTSCRTEYKRMKGAGASYALTVDDGRAAISIMGYGDSRADDGETYLKVDGGTVQAFRTMSGGDPSCLPVVPYSCRWFNSHRVALPPGELRRLAAAREILWARFPDGHGFPIDPTRLARWLADLERQGVQVN